jgi:hypothetical protein
MRPSRRGLESLHSDRRKINVRNQLVAHPLKKDPAVHHSASGCSLKH